MKRPQYFPFLIAAVLAIQLTWYGMLMISYVQAGKVEGSDFRWFYAVGLVWRQYGSHAVYDLDLASAAQAQVAGVVEGQEKILLPNHPPFVYPIMALLAGMEFRTAYFLYFFGAWMFTAVFTVVIYKLLRRKKWPRLEAFLLSCSILLFEPFFISLLKGQDSYLLLIGGLLFLAGVVDGKDSLAGVGLGLTLIRPQIALVLAIPFLFRRRKVWWWFFATAALLGIYSLIQVGWTGVKDYVQVLLLSTGVEGFGWDEIGMFDSVGFLMRILPTVNPDLIHAIGWGFYCVALAGLCFLWRRSKNIRYWHLSLAVMLSLFVAPHLHYHDLALFAAPLLIFGIIGVESRRFTPSSAVAISMVLSVIMIFSEFWEPARLSIPYLLMVGLPFTTWRLERSSLLGLWVGNKL